MFNRLTLGLIAVLLFVACGAPGAAAPAAPTPGSTTVALASPAVSSTRPSAAPSPTEALIPPIVTPAPTDQPTSSPTATPPATPTPTSSPTPKPSRTPDPGPANPNWSGRYSMYRARTHSIQKTDWYCVPTSIQMMLNLIRGGSDRSEANQQKYWAYAQEHSAYPLRDNGADPAGWVAAMSHWGVQGYSVGVSDTMQDSLKLAAKRMRLTGRPVGMIVWGNNREGGHAWVMTGFESTDDPKATDNYEVTSVQAMGPLWPHGTINGKSFDPGPREWVEYGELQRKFTKLVYSAAPPWNGRWITIIP